MLAVRLSQELPNIHSFAVDEEITSVSKIIQRNLYDIGGVFLLDIGGLLGVMHFYSNIGFPFLIGTGISSTGT